MINLRALSRVKAAVWHMIISAGIAIMLAFLVFGVWYPGLIGTAAGGGGLFLIVITVDGTLGPILTFVVFDVKKRSLPYDLAVIWLIQLFALCYGLFVVAEARPVFIVFAIDRFNVVADSDIPPENWIDVENSQFRNPPLFGPEFVVARNPDDKGEREAILFSSFQGVDLQDYPKYYVPYRDAWAEVLKVGLSLDASARLDAGKREDMQRFLEARSLTKENVVFVPLQARKQDMFVALEKSNGRIIGIVPVSPW